jgi:peptidoglycan/xylan/chitin deacetylase (PgdA/CDA1 family)
MRERLRICIAFCFCYSGLLKLARWWKRRSGRHLIILCYHRADGHLHAQLRYLQRHYRIIRLKDALEEFYADPVDAVEQREKARKDRRIPLVLTFDDGYIDNYKYGLPLVRRLQIPITIFLIPGYIESGECFWWFAPEELVQSATVEKVTIEAKTYRLSLAEDRVALVDVIDRLIRYTSSVAERERTLSDLQKALGATLSKRGVGTKEDGALPMHWEQIREMEASGLVSFGAHTMHHPILSCLSDPAEVRYEVAESRKVLEEKLGHPVPTFAYPIGMPSDIGDQGLQAAREAGFKWALTAFEEVNTPQTDAHLLVRLPGDTRLHWAVMAAELVGLLGVMSRIKTKYASIFKK